MSSVRGARTTAWAEGARRDIQDSDGDGQAEKRITAALNTTQAMKDW